MTTVIRHRICFAVKANSNLPVLRVLRDLGAGADIVSAGGRVSDELRAEISRLANGATDRVFAGGAIDAATHQNLIESFISKVGASA